MDVRNKCQRKKREGGGREWEEKRQGKRKGFKRWPCGEIPNLALYLLVRKLQWTQGLRRRDGSGRLRVDEEPGGHR